MKSKLIALIFGLALSFNQVNAEGSTITNSFDPTAQCEQWASAEGVMSSDLKEYLDDCLQSLNLEMTDDDLSEEAQEEVEPNEGELSYNRNSSHTESN